MARCRRCGRRLKNPAATIGPVCRRKAAREVPPLFDPAQYTDPEPRSRSPDPAPEPPVRPLLMEWDMFRPPAIDPVLSEREKHRRVCEIIFGR